MYRRAFLAIAAITPLAGCGGFLNDIETTLEDGEQIEFEAEEGAELSVTIDVQEIESLNADDEGEDMDIERNSVGVVIFQTDEGPIETLNVEDSKTFDLHIESDDTYFARVMGGTADITID